MWEKAKGWILGSVIGAAMLLVSVGAIALMFDTVRNW